MGGALISLLLELIPADPVKRADDDDQRNAAAGQQPGAAADPAVSDPI